MSIASGKFILTNAETWQFRRAQSVDLRLAAAVRRVCEANKTVRACFLLDTRKAEGSDLKLTIALSLDEEAESLDQVVTQLQDALLELPQTAQNAAIMSAKPFERDYAGAEFYVRNEDMYHP